MVDPSNDTEPTRDPSANEVVSRRAFLSGRRSLRSPREALQPDDAPQPPSPPKKRRRRPVVATASGILSFIGIAIIGLAIGWSLAVQRVDSAGPLEADKVVVLPPTDVSGIIDQLAQEGVIDNRFLMNATLWAEGLRHDVRFGEYLFKQGASLQEVIDTLVSGKPILHALTIPEGLTSEQVVERINEDDMLVGKIGAIPREGTLMPDTYKFARGSKREQLIANMQAEQSKVLAEAWAHRSPDLPFHSSYELVTLASIVEKETGRADERPRVAGVFINRLMRNMPLQSDPTIVYGLVGGKGTLGRGILKSELDQKTPYNTYAITGLPPGPIANPGKAALEAVANPSRTKDLYFVADGTGGHAFAENLDQHRQNVARWRQIEQNAKDKLDPDADKAAPLAVPGAATPQRGNQRGDLGQDGAAYGALEGGFAVPTAPQPLRPKPPAIATFPFDSFAATLPAAQPVRSKLVAPSSAPGSNFDELDIEVAGVRSKAPVEEADGSGVPVGGDGPSGSMATFPVAPQRLSEERARARALGLLTSSDKAPTPPAAFASTSDNAPAISNERFGRGKIFDASEGTVFDPLKDKSYDLNSAKTVPVLKALPAGTPVMSYAN